MDISLLKEQLGERYTFHVEGNSIFIYSNHYKYEPVLICREGRLCGVERGQNILISDEELLRSEPYASMIQNNTCQEIDESKEDKIIIRNEGDLSFFEYRKDDLKITLDIVPQQTKKYYKALFDAIIKKNFIIAFMKEYDLKLNAEDYLNLFSFCVNGVTAKIEKW